MNHIQNSWPTAWKVAKEVMRSSCGALIGHRSLPLQIDRTLNSKRELQRRSHLWTLSTLAPGQVQLRGSATQGALGCIKREIQTAATANSASAYF
jgi:hypothetical protein